MATSYKRKYSEVSDQLIRTVSVLVHTLEENSQLKALVDSQGEAIAALESQVERLQAAATKQIEKIIASEKEANAKPKSKSLAQP